MREQRPRTRLKYNHSWTKVVELVGFFFKLTRNGMDEKKGKEMHANKSKTRS